MSSRRSFLLYALALIVLLPATIGFVYWSERQDGPDRPEPIRVAADRTGEYAGARWRLVGISPGPVQEGEKLPKDSVLLYATISVTPKSKAAAKRIEMCQFSAVDSTGREWDSDRFIADLEKAGDPATTCSAPKGEYEEVPIPVGKAQPVVAVFLVPESVRDDLRPQVQVGRGRALQLDR